MLSWRAPSRSIALALQGGGAHGAYTWGVLDALLERAEHSVSAISGTSAGAVNAVVLAHGLLRGGHEGAREALAAFWGELGRSVPWEALGLVAGSGERLSPAGRLMLQWAQAFSPAQSNPLRVDPLRDLLAAHVDFERLRRQTRLRIHVAATHANSGRLRVFTAEEMTLETVLASACLPTLQPAVVIDGEPYWDGGYSANPAIFPLVGGNSADDVLIVMLSPWLLGATPQRVDEIRARAVEIGFNAAFLREMQLLAAAIAAARRSWWPGKLERRLRRLRWHLIDGHDALSALPADSRLVPHPQLLERLRDAGRSRAQAWLDDEGRAIGRRSSAELRALFGHHLPPAAALEQRD